MPQRVLCVPNWSEGKNPAFLYDMRMRLRSFPVQVHYDGADRDHNRLVTAFSGHPQDVADALFALSKIAFDWIDMRRHIGVHPRIGALDVCPFVPLQSSMQLQQAIAFAASVAQELAHRFALPVFLYEKSETGKHAKDLPTLRSGQFEGLAGKVLSPDFGPSTVHPWLGASVVGVRDWLIAANINLKENTGNVARQIAAQIRSGRSTDARLMGVRALAFRLASRDLSQVSLNLTMPHKTSFDSVYDFVAELAANDGVEVMSTELVGAICSRHLEKSQRLLSLPQQVITDECIPIGS